MKVLVPSRTHGTGWVARHPLAAFLVWSFTVGQAVAFVPVVASSRGVELPVQPFTAASTWFGLLLPALVITWLVDGRPAVRTLLLKVTAVRRPMRWYALSLVVLPLTSLTIAVAMVGDARAAAPLEVARALVMSYALPAGFHLVTNNLWEELAWSGFVQARLQVRHSPMVAALLTAPLFALQHTPLVVGNSLIGGVVVMAALVTLAVPFRGVMGWIANSTGSLFLVGLSHACGNALVTGTVAGDALLPALWGRNLGPVHLFSFAVIGVAVVVATHGRLGLTDGPRTVTPTADVAREVAVHESQKHSGSCFGPVTVELSAPTNTRPRGR